MSETQEKFNIAESHVDKHVRNGLGKKIALRYESSSISYEELQSQVNRAGNCLQKLGVDIEDRVMIALPDCPQHIAFFLGAMKIGAVPFNVNYQTHSALLEYYLNDSRATVAVLGEAPAQEYERAKKAKFSSLKDVVLIGSGKMDSRFENSPVDLESAPTRRDDVAYWVYTSGTTGKPRAAVHCHQDLEFCALAFACNVLDASENDVFFSTSKLNFSYGRVNSMHMPLLLGATTILYDGHPTPEIISDILTKYEVSLFFSVPTLYNKMVNQEKEEGATTRPKGTKFPKLRICVAAGEPLPQVVYRKWMEKYNVELVDGYGSSEAEYICIAQLPGKVKPDSSGVLLPGWEAMIVDCEGRRITDSNVEGNLWIKSPSTLLYYWHDRFTTKARCIGEWYDTGDMFKMDQGGYFHYVGRTDDMFKVNGMWVSPAKVENALLHNPSIAETAVIGRPDNSSGLVKATAFVVLKNGFTASSELAQQIQNSIRQHLHSYEIPNNISFVGHLPKTNSGKIQRYLLRSASEQ